jgi:hypothetical protein
MIVITILISSENTVNRQCRAAHRTTTAMAVLTPPVQDVGSGANKRNAVMRQRKRIAARPQALGDVRQRRDAHLPSLQPTASIVPLRLNADVTAMPSSRKSSIASGNVCPDASTAGRRERGSVWARSG